MRCGRALQQSLKKDMALSLASSILAELSTVVAYPLLHRCLDAMATTDTETETETETGDGKEENRTEEKEEEAN